MNEIGCHISGAEGRFDRAEHVLFNVRNLLVVIMLENFEGENAKLLWEKLGQCIFSNANMTKIFFDSCHAGDHLYHQHSIRMTNVFDLKVSGRVSVSQFSLFVSYTWLFWLPWCNGTFVFRLR